MSGYLEPQFSVANFAELKQPIMAVPRSVYIALFVSLLLGACSSHRPMPEGKDDEMMNMTSGENKNLTNAIEGKNFSYPLAEAMDPHLNDDQVCSDCIFEDCRNCFAISSEEQNGEAIAEAPESGEAFAEAPESG